MLSDDEQRKYCGRSVACDCPAAGEQQAVGGHVLSAIANFAGVVLCMAPQAARRGVLCRSPARAAEEAGQSRIYGGIHFQYDNQQGHNCGRQLADYVFDNFLRPFK